MLANYYLRFAALVDNCDPGSARTDCQTRLPQISANGSTVKIALQFLFATVAVATVIYIIIAAIRYQASLGNPEATAKLRNSIVYAAIGFVVAMSAEAIVTFTIGRI